MKVALYRFHNIHVRTSMNLLYCNSEELAVCELNTLKPCGTETQDTRRFHTTPVISHTACQPGET